MKEHFQHYLAIGIVTFSAIVFLMLMFVNIPPENKDMVNFVVGALVGMAVTVSGFYFGNSKKDKENVPAPEPTK